MIDLLADNLIFLFLAQLLRYYSSGLAGKLDYGGETFFSSFYAEGERKAKRRQ